MNLDFGSFNSMILSSALFILIQPLNKINQKEALLYLMRRKSADKDEVHYDDAAIGNFPLRWWKADKAFVKTLLLSLSDIILSYLILSYLILYDLISLAISSWDDGRLTKLLWRLSYRTPIWLPDWKHNVVNVFSFLWLLCVCSTLCNMGLAMKFRDIKLCQHSLQIKLQQNRISSIFHKCFACPNVLFQNHDSWETNSYRNFCSATTMIDCSKLGQMYFSPYSL